MVAETSGVLAKAGARVLPTLWRTSSLDCSEATVEDCSGATADDATLALEESEVGKVVVVEETAVSVEMDALTVEETASAVDESLTVEAGLSIASTGQELGD